MKVILFVNSAKTFIWHRKTLADYLHSTGHEVVVISSEDGNQLSFENLPYRVIKVGFSRKGTNPFSEIFLILKLVRIFWKEKPDLVHNFTVKCVVYGSIAQKLAGVPVVVNSITGLGYAFIKGGLIQKIVENLYRAAFLFSDSYVIFQNEHDFSLFIGTGLVRKDRAVLIEGSGVDTSHYRPTLKNPGKVNVLFAGRLLKTKGLRELIDASLKLFQSGTEHGLVIVGDLDPGNPDSFTHSEIENFKSKYPHLDFRGHIDNMKECYKEAHIACLPSYREGLSKFLIEAASTGLPIVTTDAPGCGDLVRNGNGYAVPVGSVDQLADKLQCLIESEETRKEMGRKSRELACIRYDQKVIFRDIDRIYQRSLNFKA